MPCSFLHIKDGSDLIRDQEGIDVPGAAPRAIALLSARELWADTIRAGSDLGADAFLISDQDGNQLTFVPFTEVLPMRLRPKSRPKSPRQRAKRARTRRNERTRPSLE